MAGLNINLTVSDTTSTVVVLSWNHMVGSSGDIYVFEFNGQIMAEVVYNFSMGNLVVPGLVPGTAYEVRAFLKGTGDWDNAYTTTDSEPVTGLMATGDTTTSIYVTWIGVQADASILDFNRYIIRLYKAGVYQTSKYINSPHTPFTTFTGLAPNTMYEARVTVDYSAAANSKIRSTFGSTPLTNPLGPVFSLTDVVAKAIISGDIAASSEIVKQSEINEVSGTTYLNVDRLKCPNLVGDIAALSSMEGYPANVVQGSFSILKQFMTYMSDSFTVEYSGNRDMTFYYGDDDGMIIGSGSGTKGSTGGSSFIVAVKFNATTKVKFAYIRGYLRDDDGLFSIPMVAEGGGNTGKYITIQQQKDPNIGAIDLPTFGRLFMVPKVDRYRSAYITHIGNAQDFSEYYVGGSKSSDHDDWDISKSKSYGDTEILKVMDPEFDATLHFDDKVLSDNSIMIYYAEDGYIGRLWNHVSPVLNMLTNKPQVMGITAPVYMASGFGQALNKGGVYMSTDRALSSAELANYRALTPISTKGTVPITDFLYLRIENWVGYASAKRYVTKMNEADKTTELYVLGITTPYIFNGDRYYYKLYFSSTDVKGNAAIVHTCFATDGGTDQTVKMKVKDKVTNITTITTASTNNWN